MSFASLLLVSSLLLGAALAFLWSDYQMSALSDAAALAAGKIKTLSDENTSLKADVSAKQSQIDTMTADEAAAVATINDAVGPQG